MTPAEIAEIAARWAKAQRGPWRVVLVPNIGESMIVDADGGCVDGFHMSGGSEAAIAHAPQDVAALLGEVERLEAEKRDAIASLGADLIGTRARFIELKEAAEACALWASFVPRLHGPQLDRLRDAIRSLSTTATRGGG